MDNNEADAADAAAVLREMTGGKATMPSGWKCIMHAKKNKAYYVCEETNHSQWEFPTEEDIKNPTLAMKKALDKAAKERLDTAREAARKPKSKFMTLPFYCTIKICHGQKLTNVVN